MFFFAGVQADQRAFRQLLINFLPAVDVLLREHDIELSLIALPWFVFVGLIFYKNKLAMKEKTVKFSEERTCNRKRWRFHG